MKTIEFLKNNNVNVEQSLELFGDIETYNETLIEFQNGIDAKLAELNKYYNEADMTNYAIYAHSLKSDCKYFGFMTLAEIAYEHEMQGKANNYEFVKQNFDAFMAESAKIKALVNSYLSDDDTPVVESAPVVAPVAPVAEEDIILIADDSEVIRIFVKKIFDADYELAFAENGEEALSIIKEHEADGRIKAILLDLNMPKVDGFAVLDYLQSNNLMMKMPVTIISGDSSSDVINKAFNYPIIDMLNKPFSEDKIRSAVEKTISYSK